MKQFERAGITYYCDDASIGFASNGPSTAGGAIRRIRERGLTGLRVLDICCGVGVIGLTMTKELGTEIVTSLTLADINIFNVNSAKRTIARNKLAVVGVPSRIYVVLSDGLAALPADHQFDLIVSNPPHGLIEDYTELDFSPSWLGTADEGYRFHLEFYARCADYLAPGGEVWFLENAGTAVEEHVPDMIRRNPLLDYYKREEEPLDPGYFWMLTRRATAKQADLRGLAQALDRATDPAMRRALAEQMKPLLGEHAGDFDARMNQLVGECPAHMTPAQTVLREMGIGDPP